MSILTVCRNSPVTGLQLPDVSRGLALRIYPTDARRQASHQLHATTSSSRPGALSRATREVSTFDRADQHRSVSFVLLNRRADFQRCYRSSRAYPAPPGIE